MREDGGLDGGVDGAEEAARLLPNYLLVRTPHVVGGVLHNMADAVVLQVAEEDMRKLPYLDDRGAGGSLDIPSKVDAAQVFPVALGSRKRVV